MFIKKVKLLNFCQHRDKEIEFSSGLNVIVGPNGCGKSNVLNGIYGCLTGDFTRNAGKTADNISLNRLSNQPSLIDLEFSHNNYDMRLVRKLDPIERQLYVGDSIITADKDVTEKLQNVLEVDKEIIGQYVFVEQWDHFGPLSLSAAKRISAFQKLFKIEQLNKISDKLADGSLKLAVAAATMYSLPDLITEKSNLEQKINDINTVLADMPSTEEYDLELSKHNKVSENWSRKQKLQTSMSDRLKQLETIVEEKQKLEDSKSVSSIKLIELDDAIFALKETHDSASNAEAAWVKYNYYMDQKNKCEKKNKELTDEAISKVKPEKPEDYVESTEELSKTIDDMKFKLEQHKQFISSIDAENETASCPTCGTPATNLLDRWNKAKEESEELSTSICEILKKVAASSNYDKQSFVYLTWLRGYEKRVDEAMKVYASLNVETEPEFSREEAKNVLAAYTKLTEELVVVGKQINKFDIEISKKETAASQQTAELEREKEELNKYLDLTEESVKEAQEAINKIKASKLVISNFKTDWAVNNANLKSIEEKIRNTKKQLADAEVHSSWNDRVDNLKKIFKYNALPMFLSQRYMERVVVELNKTLSQIGVPFNIELESDLSFLANFGSHKVPAARLSGGQKIILTIAYRLAVNFTFASNLGLLCLDEPTVGLDDANLGALEKAFERLKDFSLSNGVQIIVVTHEKGISHLFDRTIDLSKV